MKFRDYINESKYTIKDDDNYTAEYFNKQTTSNHVAKDEDIVGWFSNKYNKFGWLLTKLESYDQREFNPKNEKGIFRSLSDNGHTAIVKINAKTGTYAFIDNDAYEDGKIVFDKMTKYSKLDIKSNSVNLFV